LYKLNSIYTFLKTKSFTKQKWCFFFQIPSITWKVCIWGKQYPSIAKEGHTKKSFILLVVEPLRKIIYPEFFENWIEPHEKQVSKNSLLCCSNSLFLCASSLRLPLRKHTDKKVNHTNEGLRLLYVHLKSILRLT